MEGRVFEMFSKNRKIFKSPKMPKIVPKSVQLCFEHVLGVHFSKIFFCPVFDGVFEMFLKSFQKSKNAQNCSQNVQTCFEHVSGVTFSKNFFAQCSMEGRVFEMFSKNLKFFKIPKMPKIVPKIVQLCFEHVLGLLFEKKFCPVFHGGSSFRNVFKKFSKIQKCPKSFPKVSNYVLNMFWGYFFRKIFFAQCSMEGRDFGLRNVFKKSKNFQNFKKNQNRSQKCPNVFWTCFWVNFS